MLVLALVARGSDVLAEAHEPGYERFVSAAATILAKVHESGTPRVSYAFEQWLFHYMRGDDQSYLRWRTSRQGGACRLRSSRR